MRISIALAAVFIACLLPSCSGNKGLAGINVMKTSEEIAGEGIFYFLPRTAVAVDVSVTKLTHQPGPFAQYAESLLGLQNVIRSASAEYTISEISINGFAEPDPEQIYFVAPGFENSPFYLSLSEAGLVRSINKEFDSSDFSKNHGESKEYGYFGTEATFNYFIDINLQERIDTIMERVRMDTITVERQTLRRSWVEKSTDVRAKEVADYILKIRDKKFDLITGFAEIAYSKEAIEYMYTEMNKKENDYLALFTGISNSSTIKYRYTFIPDADEPEAIKTLFHFSPRDGVVAANAPGSVPVSIVARRSDDTSSLQALVQHPQEGKAGEKGFYYRIPEYATIMIREGGNPRAESRILVSQFGVVTSLPPYNIEIEFYPNTGSVKSIRGKH